MFRRNVISRATAVAVPEGKMPRAARWWLHENIVERTAFMDRNASVIASKRSSWNWAAARYIVSCGLLTVLYCYVIPQNRTDRALMHTGFVSHRLMGMADKIPAEFRIPH